MLGMRRPIGSGLRALCAAVSLALWSAAGAHPAEPAAGATQVVQLPGGEVGIGFDDLQYAPNLKKILVPGGRSGRLFLIAPDTGEVRFIDGFTAKSSYAGGHGEGTTSACEGGSLVYASDRGSRSVKIVDPAAGKILVSVSLSSPPDYVRCLPEAGEIWVTEPGKEQIEILSLSAEGRAAKPAGTLAIPGGPESLVLDAKSMRGYCHTWKGTTYAVDVQARKIVAKWSNSCEGARGIALDEKHGWLFVGCGEGKAVVLDTATGKQLASLRTGPGVDSIRYAAGVGHLVVPGGDSADASILGVAPGGRLSLLGKVKTGRDAHTAAFDPIGRRIYIGLPEHGQVLIIQDGYPPSSP